MTTRIAVDAMGGDNAPAEVVKGALLVANETPDLQIILVGNEAVIAEAIESFGAIPSNVSLRHTEQVIEMGEHPAQAIRRKRQSSLVIAGLLVKSGEADAAFSAGNTGAAMAIATLDIGRIPGVDRPAIATTLPTLKNKSVLLDAGANVDCSPENLRQFAVLGSVYAHTVLKRENPTVGLLNIGNEPGKGNELTRSAYELLSRSNINFYGNVEGKDVFEGAVDVVVCDGFAGNVLLKAGEGVAELILTLLSKEIGAQPDCEPFSSFFKPTLSRLSQRIDYAETGGAPLLGVLGVSVIGHGRSEAKAIANGIRAARDAAESGIVEATRIAMSSGGLA